MFETRRQGAIHVLTGDEPINGATLGQLDSQLIACFSQGQPRIVVDLERVALNRQCGTGMAR